MRHVFAAILFLLGAVAVAAAEPSEKWEGFRSAESAKPSFFPFLRDAVVIVETAGTFLGRKPGEKPDQWVDVDNVKPYAGKGLIRDKRRFQIETCRRAGLKKCPVMKRSTYGTGFIINGDRLYMCRHGFHNWLAWASKANGKRIEDVVIPLRIRTAAGKVLYDSSRAKPGQHLRFAFLNTDPRLNRPIDTARNYPSRDLAFNQRASDIAVLQSEQALTVSHAPLKKNAVADLAIGDEAFLFGFPDPVKGYAGGKVSGKELAGSHGFALEVIRERGAMRFSNYSNVGMSGAPVLSPEGEIIGMSCGSFGLEDRVKNPSAVNATAITLDRATLETLWRGLTYAPE